MPRRSRLSSNLLHGCLSNNHLAISSRSSSRGDSGDDGVSVGWAVSTAGVSVPRLVMLSASAHALSTSSCSGLVSLVRLRWLFLAPSLSRVRLLPASLLVGGPCRSLCGDATFPPSLFRVPDAGGSFRFSPRISSSTPPGGGLSCDGGGPRSCVAPHPPRCGSVCLHGVSCDGGGPVGCVAPHPPRCCPGCRCGFSCDGGGSEDCVAPHPPRRGSGCL